MLEFGLLAHPSHPARKFVILQSAGRKIKDCPRRLFLAGFKRETVELEKKYRNHEASPFVAVDEGMIAHNARTVQRSHFNHVRATCVGLVLAGSGQSRLQQPSVSQPRLPSVNG